MLIDKESYEGAKNSKEEMKMLNKREKKNIFITNHKIP